jgi:membrane protein DedA with SNARE-associated domain
MDPHLVAIASFIILYGYAVILPVAILEGPIITVIAAFLAAQGYFNIFVVYAVVVVGDILGDLLYYGLGRFGGRIARGSLGRKLGIKLASIEKLEQQFNDHSGKALLIGKWTHSFGLVALTGAGAAKMRLGKFVGYSTIGTIPKSLVFLLIGYYVGYAYQKINSYITKGAFLVGIVLVVAVGVYLLMKRRKNSKEKNTLSSN